MFWFVFSLLSLLFAYLGSENNAFIKIKNVQLLSRILLIITLSYVTGFSGENFQDHQGYVNYYNSINNREITSDNINFNIFGARDYGMEFGYSILNKFCYLLGFSHVGFFFFISLLTNTFLVLFIFRFKFPVFNILVLITSGLFWQECNLVRQVLAISIFLYSTKFILEKNIWKYVIGILCAATIHTSAILMLVFIPFVFIKEKYYKKINIFLFCFWLLSVFVSLGLISFDLSSFDVFAFYDLYLTNENKVGLGNIESYALFYNFTVILFFLVFDKINIVNKYFYVIIFILGSIFTNMSVNIPNFYRISLYFSVLNVVILAFFIKDNVKTKYLRISQVSFFVLCVIFVGRVFINVINNETPITYSVNQILR